MNRLNLKPIGNFVKGACKVIAYGALLTLACGVKIEYKHHESGTVKYSDAVDAIMNSNMWSSDKAEAVVALNRDSNEELYKAVIHVANGTMWSNDKVEMIKKLCGK